MDWFIMKILGIILTILRYLREGLRKSMFGFFLKSFYLHLVLYKLKKIGEKDQLNIDASRDRGRLPAGDNCIIYPGYRKLYTSIRFEAMRDGIDDYQLLKMVEEKDSTKAREFANNLVIDFDQYDNSVTHFRKIRKQILEFLSK